MDMHLEGGPGLYEYREALRQKEPVALSIRGTITAPLDFYNSRKHLKRKTGFQIGPNEEPYFDAVQTHVLADRENYVITLVVKENDYYRDTVSGELRYSSDYEAFFTNDALTPKGLSNYLRRYRYLLADQEQAMILISELSTFEANIEANVKQKDDSRGNKTNSFEVSARTNVPLKFDVLLPIFYGDAPQRITVEVQIEVNNGSNISLRLAAPDVVPIIRERVDKLFAAQLEVFKADGITILEI